MKSLANSSDKLEILTRIGQVTHNSQRRWGKMTVNQMLCHLNDSFKAVMGNKEVSSVTNIFNRTVVKWFALYAPIPWPKGVPTRPEIDQQVGGTKPQEFDKDRAELKAFIEQITHPQRDFKWQAHPIFGEMTEQDWLRWAYLHVDHHLKQFGS